MNVVEFPLPNLNNLPKMLHTLADDIEKGEHGKPEALFIILEADDGFSTFGFGATDDPLRNVGLLSAAMTLQLQLALSEDE